MVAILASLQSRHCITFMGMLSVFSLQKKKKKGWGEEPLTDLYQPPPHCILSLETQASMLVFTQLERGFST